MSEWRNLLTGGLCVLALAILAVGCGGDDSDSADGDTTAAAKAAVAPPPDLTRPGTLSVCADLSFPPMSFEDASQQPTGVDMDTAKGVADTWGVDFKAQNMPFDGVLPALSTGRCDVAWTGINVTPERLESFDAVPYLKTAEVLLVPEGNPEGIKTPADLAGKTAATQSGTIYAERLKKLADDLKADGEAAPTIQTYPKMSDAIQQLTVGRADAVLTQDTEAAYRSIEQPGQYEIAYSYPDALEFGVYFKKGDAAMRKALERALAELSADGALEKTVEQYNLDPDNLVVR